MPAGMEQAMMVEMTVTERQPRAQVRFFGPPGIVAGAAAG